jgi:cell shape-determining protein MreC
MTIAGKISLGGSVALSLATAALAVMVMGTKNRFSQQLVAVESSLRDGKFTTLGLPYTGNYIENEAEPAATVAQAGQKWDLTAIDLKTSRTQEEATKKEAEEAKAKVQELSLTAEKLTKDLSSTKSDLDSTNSKLKLTAEQLQTYTDDLKGKKPSELFTELNELSEKTKVAESENKLLATAKTKVEEELKKLRTEVEMTKPGSTKSIALSGKIVAVNPTWNFVIIDLGKNDSVVEGLTMVLYRGDKMIGKVKTVTVDAQTSVADVLPGTPASAIEIGDQVVY